MKTFLLSVIGVALAAPAAHAGANRHACPLDKPQKLYGWDRNAVTAFIEKEDTWTPENVYLVFGTLHVKGTLIIKAGTTVCFEYGPANTDGRTEPPPGELDLEPGGTLKVLGTADQHVVFTQKDGKDQYWAGMYFSSGAKNDQSTMQWLDIYNSGINGAQGAISTFPDFKAPPLDMQNVTFYSLYRLGIRNLTSGFTAATRIVVDSYADEVEPRDLRESQVLRVHPYAAKTVNEQSFRVGESVPKEVRFIQLDHATGMNIEKDVTLHKLQPGLAWRPVANMKMNGAGDDPPSLKIDAGAVIAVDGSGYIHIGNGGMGGANIVAAGTPALPIVFTSDAALHGREPEPGDWMGIELYPGNFKASVSRFENVVFEYGGHLGQDTIYNCNDGRSDRGAVVLFTIASNGNDYDGPPIKNSVWRKAGGAGVRARCNVQHTGGCLKTNYEDPKLGNKFVDFDAGNDRPATTPLTCPN